MKLERHILLGLQSTITHNVAQKLVQGKKEEGKQYIQECKQFFQEIGLDEEQIAEIIVTAHMKAKREAITIKRMYKKQNIKINVSGNGGSEINVRVMLETILEVAITKEEE